MVTATSWIVRRPCDRSHAFWMFAWTIAWAEDSRAGVGSCLRFYQPRCSVAFCWPFQASFEITQETKRPTSWQIDYGLLEVHFQDSWERWFL